MPGKGKQRSLALLFSEVFPLATTREIPKYLSIRRSVRFAPQGDNGADDKLKEGLHVIEQGTNLWLTNCCCNSKVLRG
jgi:hypothetical protein